ncbi:probable LRR receptor-like serine/threonine-protein kinase isoform X1 [Tanacetum coccineum]
MKAVPPPLSGNYIPLSDPTDLDESQMTYGPKQTHTSDLDSCESNTSVESLESMPKPVIIEPKTSEYAFCKSNLSAKSHEFFPKFVCAMNESVRKDNNRRKTIMLPRGRDNVSKAKLTWPIRLKICLGIARGLVYLHEGSQLRIVHRDIKTSNVLLDKKLDAKISDFGLYVLSLLISSLTVG